MWNEEGRIAHRYGNLDVVLAVKLSSCKLEFCAE